VDWSLLMDCLDRTGLLVSRPCWDGLGACFSAVQLSGRVSESVRIVTPAMEETTDRHGKEELSKRVDSWGWDKGLVQKGNGLRAS